VSRCACRDKVDAPAAQHGVADFLDHEIARDEGWEAVLFLMIFLAIWQLGSYRAGG
jgi:hypothetical protein